MAAICSGSVCVCVCVCATEEAKLPVQCYDLPLFSCYFDIVGQHSSQDTNAAVTIPCVA